MEQPIARFASWVNWHVRLARICPLVGRRSWAGAPGNGPPRKSASSFGRPPVVQLRLVPVPLVSTESDEVRVACFNLKLAII
jgi:hypothetical protein